VSRRSFLKALATLFITGQFDRCVDQCDATMAPANEFERRMMSDGFAGCFDARQTDSGKPRAKNKGWKTSVREQLLDFLGHPHQGPASDFHLIQKRLQPFFTLPSLLKPRAIIEVIGETSRFQFRVETLQCRFGRAHHLTFGKQAEHADFRPNFSMGLPILVVLNPVLPSVTSLGNQALPLKKIKRLAQGRPAHFEFGAQGMLAGENSLPETPRNSLFQDKGGFFDERTPDRQSRSIHDLK
jgi:hypothetical protein